MKKILCVRDSKMEAYLQPFFAPTTAVGLRMVSEVATEPEHDFHKYAADYTLFELGQFDESTGLITLHTSHVNLGTMLQFQHTDEVGTPPMPMRMHQDISNQENGSR